MKEILKLLARLHEIWFAGEHDLSKLRKEFVERIFSRKVGSNGSK